MLIKNKITKFSDKWWDDFLSETDYLTKTKVINNCLSSDETTLYRKYVLQILKVLAHLRTDKYGYRIYVDGRQLDINGMNDIYDQPPLDDETLEEWSERVFKDKKFGIIINLGEKFNLELSKDVALKVEPYLEKIGFPREGINFSIFIGNYDKTPLGIHKDPPGQDVMHFHLGPNGKTMYTWERELYEDLIKNKNFEKQDVSGLLPYSTKFSFEEGDMYFMPEGEYHIGEQEGLSIAITFWRYNHTKDKLARKLQNVLLNQFMKNNEDLLEQDQNELNDVCGLDSTLDIFNIPEEMENMNYKDLMRQAYKDLRYSIQSNAGYRTSPFIRKEKIEFSIDDIIQVEQPFKILYKESINKDKLHVFVRGAKLELNNFECIKDFINLINDGEPHRVSILLDLLNKEWDDEIGFHILSLLYINNGIVIQSLNNSCND